MNTSDDNTDLDFWQEPRTLERTERRPRHRPGPRGPRRPSPPPGSLGLGRLAGLVVLGIAVILGFVFWVGSCQGQSAHDEYASYLAKIQPLAQDSAVLGKDFANEFTVRSLTLADLESKLGAWSRQEQQDYAAAQRILPPGPLQTAHAQVLAAFQLRALGLAGLAATLAQGKSGGSSSSTVAANLAGQAQLLGASDVVWQQLFRLPVTDTLTREGVTGLIVPASQFVTSPNVLSAVSLGILYARVGTPTTGGGRTSGLHGSALVSTQAVEGGKTTTLSTTAPATVAVGSGLVVQVTFVDSGNFPEVNIPVTLDITVSGKSVYTKTENVAQIVSKQQTTVSFSNLQVPPSAFGHSAKISVNIGKVPGEVRLDNNSATYPVFFSLAPA